MKSETELNILHIDSSSRYNGSNSRTLSQHLIDTLSTQDRTATVTKRDLYLGLPFINEDWINANFTPDEERTAEQKETLELSDQLIQELFDNDVIIIGLPMYNFGIPATFKAWIDLITRARKTFQYTENGAEGLITGKKAYIIAATGGTPIGSEADFATSYVKFILSFIGIQDIEVITADFLMADTEDKIKTAKTKIELTANRFFKAA